MKVIPAVLVFLITFSTAWAGEKGGNGGDAVVCRNSQNEIISALALDAFEAKTRRNIDVVVDASLTRDEAVAVLLNRLERRSPLRAKEFKNWSADFDQQALWLDDQELVDIPDSGHLSFPNGCKVEQLIIQAEPRFSEDLRYTINAKIWKELSPSHQAIMILHELFMREFKGGRDELFDTAELRYLNSIIFSGKVSNLETNKWLNILMQTQNLEYVETDGVNGRVLKKDLVKHEDLYLVLLPKASYSQRYKYFIRGYEGLLIHQDYTQYKEDRIAILPTIEGVSLYGWNGTENHIESRGRLYIQFGPLWLSLATQGRSPVQVGLPDPSNGRFSILSKDYYNLWCHSCDVNRPYGNEGVFFEAAGMDLVKIELNINSIYEATVKAYAPYVRIDVAS